MTVRMKRLGRVAGGAALLIGLVGLAVIASARVSADDGTVTIPLAPPLPAPPLPGIVGPAGAPLVMIDAGHGGHDSGARSATGDQEKDLTLALALSIRDALARGGRVRVGLTRADDRFLVSGDILLPAFDRQQN